jgi:hypothetical protein
VIQVCYHCQRPTAEPVVVAEVHGASVGGRTVYACPQDASRFPARPDPLAEIDALRRARREGTGSVGDAQA